MSNTLNPVFGQWYTERQLGNGTDGKVFRIYKEKYNGEREYSILKMIRLGENRNERKTFDLNESSDGNYADFQEGFDKIIHNIKRNIETVKKADNGKHFIRYEDFELRNASDGKGKLILIRLEEGKSLSEVTKGFSFTYDETVRLGINICQALKKCRSFGYIYPNLKPENILFDREGRCKLGDFGSFSCLEPSKTSVSYKRTEYYMAPEFIRTGNINCTCDTYSLGLILYMLTNRNRLPFTEPYPHNVTVNSLNDSIKKRLNGEEMPKPAFAGDGLWNVIKKACAVKPNNRYFTPEQMLADLVSVMKNEPFGEAKFDDVYSVSKVEEAKEEVVIPQVEVKEIKKEEELKVVSLKEEIQIPQTPVFNYRPSKKVRSTEPQVKYDKLIDTKPRAKLDLRGIKKLIISFIIALVLIGIFMLSVNLNASAVVFEGFDEYILYVDIYKVGEYFWHLI